MERRVGRSDVLPVTRTKDGRLANDIQLERVEKAARSTTDCFLFCHGWLYDEAEARQESARFFALLDAALAPLRDRVALLRVGLHWPSKPFADPGLTRDAADPGLWPELERRMTSRTCAGRADAARLLSDLCRAEIPASPEEEAELDLLLRRLTAPDAARVQPVGDGIGPREPARPPRAPGSPASCRHY